MFIIIKIFNYAMHITHLQGGAVGWDVPVNNISSIVPYL